MSLLVGFQHKKEKGGEGGAGIHPKRDFCCGDGYFSQKKNLRKRCVNRDKFVQLRICVFVYLYVPQCNQVDVISFQLSKNIQFVV